MRVFVHTGVIHPDRQMHTCLKDDHTCSPLLYTSPSTPIQLLHKCTEKSGGVNSDTVANVDVLQGVAGVCVCVSSWVNTQV